MYDAKTDAMATLGIIPYVATHDGKEKARTVIDEWIKRIQLRDTQLRQCLMQFVDSVNTPVLDEQTAVEDERERIEDGQNFLMKFVDSVS